jgi:hypothetical protein
VALARAAEQDARATRAVHSRDSVQTFSLSLTSGSPAGHQEPADRRALDGPAVFPCDDRSNPLSVVNVVQRIGIEQHQVSEFADGDTTGPKHLEWRQTGRGQVMRSPVITTVVSVTGRPPVTSITVTWVQASE